jgi:hypothetical protein
MMLESWHEKSERCEGVKSGEEGRQVFADAMQEGSCSHTKSLGR